MATNNLTLTASRNWRNRDENSDYHQSRQLSVPRPMNNQQEGEGGGMDLPWRLFEDRVRTGPFGLARFPSRPHSPAQIIIIEANINNERILNPTLLRFIQNSPPQIRTEWQLNLAPNPQSPALTNSQFNTAIKKLKKQTYNPPQPRKTTWKKRGLFSNRNNYAEENEKKKNEDEKQCVICLEYFVPREEVMVTPCNHMFHDKCVVEWVRRNGRCPVCRFVLCETNYGDGTVSVYGGDLALEVLNLVRAMEEAFMWMHLSS